MNKLNFNFNSEFLKKTCAKTSSYPCDFLVDDMLNLLDAVLSQLEIVPAHQFGLLEERGGHVAQQSNLSVNVVYKRFVVYF